MTPQDVAGPVITIETLSPWLQAIAPPVEPLRTLARHPPAPAPAAADPLRPAA